MRSSGFGACRPTDVRVSCRLLGRQLVELGGHTGAVHILAFSPDGRLVASGDAGENAIGRVRVWEVASGRQLVELGGHTGAVRAVAFSPDGRLLASGDSHGITRFWDTGTYTLIATIVEFDAGWAVLLPDGSYKLVGNAGDRLWWAMKLCRFEPGELDGLVPSIRRLDPDTPIPGLERYQPPS